MTSLASELDLSTLTDEELGQRAVTDLTAFAELYQRYSCAIFGYVRAQVRDKEIAEDITAQVFFKALDSADSFRNEGSYAGWLFRIAHNCLVTWRRDNERKPVAIEDLPEPHDPTLEPPTQVMVREARELLWERIAELPEDQRKAIDLRYLKDLSIEEIARGMRRSVGAVRVLLHRARRALRRSVGGDPLP